MATSNKTTGAAPLTVAFDGSGSSDPDGDTLTYDWDFGDGSAHSSAAKPSHTYSQPGTFQAKLTVSDGRGKSASKTIAITAGGTAPVATITAPATGFKYRDGDQVQLSGSATDPDQGQLPASALSWQVILHHGSHTHFNSSFTGVAQATFTAQRDHDADSYYEVRLTATDSQGLTNTKTVEIQPQTTTATIASTPSGAPVTYGGRAATAPFSATTAIGYSTTATAASSFTSGGRPFLFDGWSDGVTGNTRNLTVPETGVDLRALYLEDKGRGHARHGVVDPGRRRRLRAVERRRRRRRHALELEPAGQPVLAGRPGPRAHGRPGPDRLGGRLRQPVPDPDLGGRQHLGRGR